MLNSEVNYENANIFFKPIKAENFGILYSPIYQCKILIGLLSLVRLTHLSIVPLISIVIFSSE